MTNRILTAVDFSDTSGVLIEESCRLARQMDAQVWLVHVAANQPAFAGYDFGTIYIRGDQLRTQRHSLMQMQDTLRSRGVDTTTVLLEGNPVETILDQARELKPELIVMGSHGHGMLYHLVMGSTCAGVMRHAPCPVTVVPCNTVFDMPVEERHQVTP